MVNNIGSQAFGQWYNHFGPEFFFKYLIHNHDYFGGRKNNTFILHLSKNSMDVIFFLFNYL